MSAHFPNSPGRTTHSSPRHDRRLPAFLGTAALCLLLAWLPTGCATFQHDSDIDVTIASLHFAEATVLETTAVFTLRLQNESPSAIKLDGGVHKIYLDGIFIGKGLSGDPIEIPRFGAVTQPVKVYLRNLTMASRIKTIVEARKVDYRVDSVLHGAPGNPWSRVRISHEGTFDLRDFQPSPNP